jgi:ABC-type Fe3+-siderophore transport system permease subunit
MGLFVERVVPEGPLTTAVTDTMRADPEDAINPIEVERHVEAVKQATKTAVNKYMWARILVSVLIGGALIAVGILLTVYADNWAADQALKEATTQGYKAATSGLPAVATSIIALGSAWSGALVGVILSEKAGT